MSASDRRLHVLQAIVVEHVQTNEPVSSKAVAEGHVTGVSSATIRADMSALERDGFIQQPHTSAGRVPTDAGYRRFVDELHAPGPISEQSRRRIEKNLGEVDAYEELVGRAVRLLARLTGQAAIAEYPDLSLAGIRQIEVIDLLASRLLVLVISTTGRIAKRQIDLGADVALTDDLVSEVSTALTELSEGKTVREVREELERVVDVARPELRAILAPVAESVRDILRPLAVSRFATSGASNLARVSGGFTDVASVLEVLEDQASLVRVLGEVHTEPLDVSIGAENRDDHLHEASLVSATYEVPETTTVHVGILGPTRMDYPRSLAAVQAVSERLTELLLGKPQSEEPQEEEPSKEETA
ncbi:heat-inducible transcriptional repressor HrcA [Actinomycetaceae bacterium MB13-C1-2]|nr:heat-inducible transcriptional repressor HrcA [Actinomycetaceae bacterium MB13-C1-2]